MSLLGKILACLNVLGAIGLICVAAMGYGKRHSWAHADFRYDLVIKGLPVNAEEQGEDGTPLVSLINDEDKSSLFQNVGMNPVVTQQEEVQRLDQLIGNQLQTTAGQSKVAQTYLLARILLPFIESYHEREQILACRAHFANDNTFQAFKKRCLDARALALLPGKPGLPARPFSQEFRAAFRSQSGEPAETFLSLLLRNIPDDRKQAAAAQFEQAWDAAVETQRVALEQRYRMIVDEALGKSPDVQEAQKQPGTDRQKVAIARLLYGLAPYLAEDAIFSDPSKAAERATLENIPNFATYQERLIATQTYEHLVNRMLVICGMKSGVTAISQRASALSRLGDYITGAVTEERQQFTFDHASRIEQLRELAVLVKREQTLINENKEQLAGFETVVRERMKEIEILQAELKKQRADTAEAMKKLREMSQEVLDSRLKIRDAILANENGERRIREMEKQIRELKAKKN